MGAWGADGAPRGGRLRLAAGASAVDGANVHDTRRQRTVPACSMRTRRKNAACERSTREMNSASELHCEVIGGIGGAPKRALEGALDTEVTASWRARSSSSRSMRILRQMAYSGPKVATRCAGGVACSEGDSSAVRAAALEEGALEVTVTCGALGFRPAERCAR